MRNHIESGPTGRPAGGAVATVADRFGLVSADEPVARGPASALDHRARRPGERGAAGPSRPLSHRDRAILRAVAGGTAQLVVSVEPDLFLDGRCCSDQAAARRLAHAGLIAAATPGGTGQRVPAALTPAGRRELLAS